MENPESPTQTTARAKSSAIQNQEKAGGSEKPTVHGGDRAAAEKLLPAVYDELRKLAAQRMAQERPGQTLDATALVHEAYLRLVKIPNSEQ
jgi:ECF sigma factor